MSEIPRYQKKDDPKPQGTPGKLQFYTMRFCPYAQRSLLVLEHKQIPYDVYYMGLRADLPDWAREMNPNGQVPIVDDNGKVLYESLVVSEYLDTVYPGEKLTPQDPYVKAKHDILVANYSKVISAFYKTYTKEDRNEPFQKVLDLLEPFEKELTTDYFGGAKPALIDYNMWPWIERYPAIIPGKTGIPADRFPKLAAWVNRMEELPAVRSLRRDNESHNQFIESVVAGKADWAIGLRKD